MKLLKVLVLNWRSIVSGNAGGAEIHCYEIFGRIARKGHIVNLVTSCDRVTRRDQTTISKIREIHVTNKEVLYPFFSFYALRKLPMRKFDIVVEDVSKFPVVWPLFASKLLSKSFAIIVHHVHGKTLFQELHPLLALTLFLYEIFTLKLYSFFNPYVVTVSKSTKRELIALGFSKERITIIYNGIDFDRVHMRSLESKALNPLLVYVGRVKRYKRLDHVVRAMKEVLSEISNAKLIIAGKGDWKVYEELALLAKKLRIGSNVKLLGEIDEERKKAILQKAWIFVATSMKEGFGISAIEAQAFGTPVIAYDVPGLRDSVRHGFSGLLVNGGDLVALANACALVCEDVVLRKRLSKGALKHASIYSWDTSTEQFLALLTQIVHNHRQDYC